MKNRKNQIYWHDNGEWKFSTDRNHRLFTLYRPNVSGWTKKWRSRMPGSFTKADWLRDAKHFTSLGVIVFAVELNEDDPNTTT